jgi:hypothetical protein
VPAWLYARDRFFRKRVHAHAAVEHELRSSTREFCALCKELAVLFVELALQHGGQLTT